MSSQAGAAVTAVTHRALLVQLLLGLSRAPALGRDAVQEEINLVTEQSLRPGQKGRAGNKIIKK